MEKKGENKQKISAIIPIYGAEPYLRRCLDSVCGQTLHEIEIICINDASHDDSLTILHEYIASDRRIVVIDFSRNLGVSAARNAGVAVACGEYLSFVDSDDAIEPHFYEKLYVQAQKSGAAIVKGQYVRIQQDGTIIRNSLNEHLRSNKFLFVHQWQSAIYQTEFIRKHGISCPLGIITAQDQAFLYKALYLSPSVDVVDDTAYLYFRRSDSSSTDTLESNKIIAALKAYKDVVLFINSRDIRNNDYENVFFICIDLSLILVHRTKKDDFDSQVLCATEAINIYNMCRKKKLLDLELLRKRSKEHHYILSQDALGLATYLVHNKKKFQQVSAKLRSRLQENNNLTQ
jgi:glycosyltransferase involved in cell wall biosynthesis